jgi:hypothetical protein
MPLSFYDPGANQEWTRFSRTLRVSSQVFENSRVSWNNHLSDNAHYSGAAIPSRSTPFKTAFRRGYLVGASRASSDARVD